MNKRLPIIFILIIFLLTGCSGKSSTSNSFDGEMSKAEITQGMNDLDTNINKGDVIQNSQGTTQIYNVPIEQQNEDRKIIDRADLSMETLNFDDIVNEMDTLVNNLGGYYESTNIFQDGISQGVYKSNRSGQYIIRIPRENFNEFLTNVTALGTVTNKRTYGEDISVQYYDNEARLKVYRAQEERYLEILGGAKDVKEILEIEKSLTEIRYQIESLTASKNQMNNLVDYSTINVYIQEVTKTSEIEKEPVTFGERIVKAFNDSIKGMKSIGSGLIIFFVVIIPYLILLTVVGFLVYLIYKRIIKKNK